MLKCYHDFLAACVPKIENAFDPDFIIDEVAYHIEKVQKINGFGCRYLLSSELIDDAEFKGQNQQLTTSYQGNQEDRRLFVAKGYIFADERQCRVY